MAASDVPVAPAPVLPVGALPLPAISAAHRVGPDRAVRVSRWSRPPVIIAAVFVVIITVSGYLASEVAGPDSPAAAWANNMAQLTAAVFAAVAAAVVVSRHTGAQRRAWLLVTVACGFWAVGQLYWSYVELVQRVEVPEVSPADFFFLAFTVLMAFAVWPSDGRHTDRLRTVLDGFVIGLSLLTISWVTSLNTLARAASGSDLPGTLINLAYPCGDIVVLTTVLLGASRRTGESRSSLAAVAAAMALIAVSDSFYAIGSAAGGFEAGSITALGWTAGFGLIGCAAVAARDRPAPGEQVRSMLRDSATAFPERSRRASALPYIPLAIALVVVTIGRLGSGVDRIAGVLLVFTFVGVLLRQYLTIRDNQALTRHLENRERELKRQAFADQLTGLPNRALFTDRVTHALELHRRSLRPLALLFIDLDDFKAVNDTLGHPVGDELVIRVAERLHGAMRNSDTVARFGGDEFAVLIEGDIDGVTVGSRIVEALRTPFNLRSDQLSIGASIGIAEVLDNQLTPTLDELFSQADIAMYAAKRAGKGQLAIYDPSMVLPEAADLQYRPLLIDAMKAGDIDCVYQPIIDLRTGRVHSVEVLARWRVGAETVQQDYFIKLCGRLGLLPDLTDLMLERACAQLAEWSVRCDRPDLQIGVNAPPGLMTDREFPRRVGAVLGRHGLGPDRLILEITEDALLGETALAQQIAERLRRMGVQLWLDDFGTGYSSLLSLRQMSLQAVKIDIAFVANIHTDPSAERFLRALLALGRDLDLLVTAEGVELVEQADISTLR